jgi:hypothetical protein
LEVKHHKSNSASSKEPEKQVANDRWLMLVRSEQGVCALETLWPFDFHFPIYSGPGTDNEDPPFTFSVAKDMFDHGKDFSSCTLIARVLHVDHYGHSLNFIEVSALESSDLKIEHDPHWSVVSRENSYSVQGTLPLPDCVIPESSKGLHGKRSLLCL